MFLLCTVHPNQPSPQHLSQRLARGPPSFALVVIGTTTEVLLNVVVLELELRIEVVVELV